MKCSNCGFDSDRKYCPMCGTKLEVVDNSFQNYNPYEKNTNNKPSTEQLNQTQPQYTNPAPYQYNPQQDASIPPTNQHPQYGMPIPPQGMYPPFPQQPQPKSSNNSLPIILSLIIGCIIVIGIVINIICAIAFKTSVYDSVTEEIESYTDSYNVTEEELEYKYFSDDTAHSLGETSQFVDGTVTLTDFKITKDKFENDSNYKVCAITLEIKNTSSDDLEINSPYIELSTYSNDYCEQIYTESDDFDLSEYNFTLKPDETKELIMVYKVPKDTLMYNANVYLSSYNNFYDFDCKFNLNLTDQTTEKTN